MKVAVIGLGYWGPNLVRNFLALGQEVYVYDRVASRCAEIVQKFPGCITLASANQIFDDPGIIGVALSVPLPEHGALVISALQAGKHVFVEKPLCQSMAEVDMIRRNLNGSILMVGHITHFSPGIRMLLHHLKMGAIGTPMRFALSRTHLGPMYFCTDVLTEVAAHDIAILLSAKPERPQLVQAWGICRLGFNNPDAAHLVITWLDGTFAQIDVQWSSALRRRTFIAEGNQGTAVFRADTGNERLELHDQEASFVALKEGAMPNLAHKLMQTKQIELSECEPLRKELGCFLKCIEEHTQPEIDLEFSSRVVSILEAARLSMANGGKGVEAPW